MATSLTFGDLLRQHRLAAGLTQQALAEQAGLSEHGIQKLERGVTHPYRDTLQRLLGALTGRCLDRRAGANRRSDTGAAPGGENRGRPGGYRPEANCRSDSRLAEP